MTETKLNKFCYGVIELGWLVALITAPLFFNTYSSRVFEPDKAAILRSIALIMAAAWLIKLLEESGVRFQSVRSTGKWWEAWARIPLLVPLFLYILSYLVSAFLSVSPYSTWAGSYTRMQGAYTTFAYLIIFISIAAHLRRRAQVERLITTVIMTSLPISIYGVMQRMQLDPLPWGEDTIQRVTSTMGNAIFVSAYLIMAFPFTFMRIVQEFRIILKGAEQNIGDHIARASVYALALVTQGAAIWLSGSRGPLLGLMMGMFFWGVLVTLAFKQRKITIGVVGLASVAGVFLVVFNLPNTPFLDPIRSINFIGRLGRIFEQGGTGEVREIIWKGAVDMALPHPAIAFPDNKTDTLNALRPFIGYGPESIHVAYNPFYRPELAHSERRSATPDRAHNETFDALLTTGVIGTLAYLAFFAALVYYALKWLGVITPNDKSLYLSLYIGGGIMGAAVMILWQGPEYFGVGLPFGIMVGLLAYLSFIALKRTPVEIDPWRALIIASALSAIVGHFVEIHFGIAIVSTRTHFWAFTGIIIAVGWAMPQIEAQQREAATALAAAKPESKRKSPQLAPRPTLNLFSGMLPTIIVSLILITLTYDFIANTKQLSSLPELFRSIMTTLYGTSNETSYGVPILLAIIWLAGSLLLNDQQESMLLTLMGSFVFWFAYTIVHISSLVNVASFVPRDIQQLLILLNMINGLLTTYTMWISALIFVGALASISEMPAELTRWNVQIIIAPALFLVALGYGFWTNTMMVQADITYKIAQPLERQQRWDIALPVYEYAIKLAPEQDQYYLFLGRAYLESGNKATDRLQQDAIVQKAATNLQQAQKLNPLNPDHSANLARMLQAWSRTAPDLAESQKRVELASQQFTNALRLNPNMPWLWSEAARFDVAIRKDYQSAQSRIEHAIKSDPELAETYILYAEYWTTRGLDEKDPDKQRAFYVQAIEQYKLAFEAPYKPELPSQLSALTNMAVIQRNIGDHRGAINTYQTIIAKATKEYNLWEVYRALAEVHYQKGDKGNALDYATRALAFAPAEGKPAIQNLITVIKQ